MKSSSFECSHEIALAPTLCFIILLFIVVKMSGISNGMETCKHNLLLAHIYINIYIYIYIKSVSCNILNFNSTSKESKLSCNKCRKCCIFQSMWRKEHREIAWIFQEKGMTMYKRVKDSHSSHKTRTCKSNAITQSLLPTIHRHVQ